MASKTKTPATKAVRATNRTRAAARVAKARPILTPATTTAEQSAAATAAQTVAGQTNTVFAAEVQDREGRIQQAVQQRASDVAKMHSEHDREQAEAERRATETRVARERLAETRVPVKEVKPVPVGPGPAPVTHAAPGTGVADPRDLAPGQDLSPCPPGGVAIAPLPDKPGTVYSQL